MSKGIRVTVEDLDTGEREEKTLPAGEYLVIATEPCHVAHTTAHGNGTHIVTIKGRTA
jgi:hypothetical protein